MTVIEMIDQAREAVQAHKLSLDDFEALIIGLFAPKRVNYYEYIQSAEWKRKADAAKKRAGYRCQVCNCKSKRLDAHHRTYERLGNERPEDITVLCHKCHELYETNKRAF
jgi:hypothetical protein